MNIGSPQKNKRIFRKTPKYLFGVFLILMVFIGGYFTFSGHSQNKEEEYIDPDPSNPPINEEEEPEESCSAEDCVRRRVDGRLVPKTDSQPRLWAITMDNHTRARPASGLAEAVLVYETEAEGGITRYLAIFPADRTIEKIGPIRSARPYFLDWAQGLSAVLVHCGGSPAALARLEQEGILSLNEFYNSGYFWREPDEPSPHNIYASSETLKAYTDRIKRGEGLQYSGWKFETPSSSEKIKEQEIVIPFEEEGYRVKWEYDPESGEYLRYLDHKVHSDEQGENITASNVVLQFTNMRVLDDKLRLDIETIGKGKAFVCSNGECREGYWQKDSPAQRTKYYTPEGDEMKFIPGNTWIEVVRESRENMIKK